MKHRHILILLLMPAFALAAIIGQPAVQALSDSLFASAPVDTTIIHSTDTLVGADTAIPGDADGTQTAGDGSVSDGSANLPQVPEPPATDGFVPTMMSDLEAADPTTGLTFITPPTANNRGTASLTYPLQMPPARNGMQPQLALSYSSDGGSGWLGEGWDIAVPAITVDTRWGVPRYDSTNETETYLLNGQMLCFTGSDNQMHVAHRGELQVRQTDRRFFTRQGGDFSKIVRKGSSPADYYWEVTDTRGTIYTYGGNANSRLQGTVNGNTVTAEWRLSRIEELHGDYISYEYAPTNETALGSLQTKALYLSAVKAGNSNEEAHTTVTFCSGTPKHISQSNARYGFLTSSNALLDSVTVKFRGNLFRSYGFSFSEGAFRREHLDAVRQYDADGVLASFQTFDYYDDTEGGTKLFADSIAVLTSTTSSDGAGLLVFGSTDGGRPTMLGSDKGKSTGGSLYVGLGTMNAKPGKIGTTGVATSYSRSTSEGLVSLTDIDGDGLPDKVCKRNGSLRYSPLLPLPGGGFAFGAERAIHGRSTYSKSKSTNFSIGPQTNQSIAVLGWGKNFSKTTTTDYFTDVNGDGLADIVSGDKVYFNHIENGVPTFTLSSQPTPSPVEGGGSVDADLCEADPDEQAQLLNSSPMHDVVRLWRAPQSGTVAINTRLSLLPPTDDEDIEGTPDGITAELQINGTRHLQQHIAADDYSEHQLNKTCTVSAGDRVYFRLRSGANELSNGSADHVRWGGTVSYTGTGTDTLADANGYRSYSYDLREASFPSARIPLSVEGGSFRLTGRLDMPGVNDYVYYRVFTVGTDGSTTQVFQHLVSYDAQDGYHGLLEADIENAKHDSTAFCEVYAKTNIPWEQIDWKPKFIVGGDTLDAAVHYYTYDEMHRPARPFHSPFSGKVSFLPVIQLDGYAPKFCYFAIKRKNWLNYNFPVNYANHNTQTPRTPVFLL